MKKDIRSLVRTLKPLAGIVYCLAVIFAAHLLWKWVVDGNLYGQQIAIFGKDCTPFFYQISQWTAKVIYSFASLFPGAEDLHLNDTNFFFTEKKITLSIIWGCTGIKQFYVFLLVILLYPGPWKKKLWYIPVGILILWAYNIARITAIIFLTRNHPEWFDFLHEGLFRYLYYGLIFFLWVYWEEKLRKSRIKQ